MRTVSFTCALLLSLSSVEVRGFAPTVPATRIGANIEIPRVAEATTRMNLSASSSQTSSLPDVDTMKAKELRNELQSYGISTKSFFEKSELVDAVQKARAEGKTPKSTSSTSTKDSTSEGSSSSSTGTPKASREERLKEEMDKCKSMKVGELKKELQSYGVSTKSFFEKSEFVRAVAEARVDGKTSSGGGQSSVDEEPYDPSYRDVVMRKMTDDPRMLGGGPLIDIRLG